jgi:hypothetical protein
MRMNLTRKLGVLAAAGVVLAVAGAVPAGQALEKPGTVTVTDSEIRHAHVDMGARGAGVGDLDVYTTLLYNKRVTPRSIGRGTMICTATGASGQYCSATYVLPKGQIVAEGAINSRLIYAMAVVGGTGLYDNVRGTLTVTSLRRKPSRALLVFRLVV